ncbi:barnase inhibitor [Amycolatopsis sp. DSM 110486]|uniref:barnase inhibitor n=1 Tax=Amycolatopsis sp. DSM 110486 TaxID=2865832 RepID=UPI001C6A42D4|nr:barnase inhibitor [Amycolatopsis sp. DSM 110486]QYN19835.1 barnase inhibitor [Amycolatopsis sp. DSM 110486]
MTGNDEDLPVLLVDGSRFSDFAGFVREFSRLLDGYRWRGSLDAFNDVLRGGFGTPDRGWVLRWLDSDVSRRALGYEATVHWLEENLLVCHPGNRSAVAARIAAAQRGEGPTLFDAIVDIIRIHGPGGRESEDGILLELA